MVSNWSGILGALATVLALVQAPSGPFSRLTATRISPRQHAPMKFRGLRPDGTVTSENWSGYAVTGSSFTQALGSWIVPKVMCPTNGTATTYSSFWVGLDGYSSSTVEQIGTDSDCNGSTPSYYAWYEFYPKFPVNIFTVSSGDTISAEVMYDGKDEFTLTITDQSTGTYYSVSSKVPQAKRSSAEWIAEKTSSALPDFGTVGFGLAFTNVSGTNSAIDAMKSGSISSFPSVEAITLVNSAGATEATPSSLTNMGTATSSFSVMQAPID